MAERCILGMLLGPVFGTGRQLMSLRHPSPTVCNLTERAVDREHDLLAHDSPNKPACRLSVCPRLQWHSWGAGAVIRTLWVHGRFHARRGPPGSSPHLTATFPRSYLMISHQWRLSAPFVRKPPSENHQVSWHSMPNGASLQPLHQKHSMASHPLLLPRRFARQNVGEQTPLCQRRWARKSQNHPKKSAKHSKGGVLRELSQAVSRFVYWNSRLAGWSESGGRLAPVRSLWVGCQGQRQGSCCWPLSAGWAALKRQLQKATGEVKNQGYNGAVMTWC